MSEIVGHSAKVEMWLHVGGVSLSVVQAGDRKLKLANATVLPALRATFEIVVDGESRKSDVIVTSGGSSRWIDMESLNEV